MRPLPPVASSVVVAVATIVSSMVGGAETSLPVDLRAWGPWMAGAPPEAVVVAMARAFGLIGSGYLLALIVAHRVVRGHEPAETVLNRLTPTPVRRWVRAGYRARVAGIGLAAAVVPGGCSSGTAASVPAPSPDPAPVAVTMVELSPAAAPEMPSAHRPAPLESGRRESPVPGAPAPQGPDLALPEVWVVEPGDHLWHIAAATVEERTGRRPTETDIMPYWRRLVEANRSRLVVASNPDLIYPGQVMVLPD